MNALKRLRWWSLAVALVIALAGCGGGSTGEAPPAASGGDGGEAAGFDFTLTSFARSSAASSQNLSSAQSAGPSQPSQVLLQGQLLVESLDANTETTYDWALLVDENAFRISTAVTLDLDAGRYNFFFLLQGNGQYYAGIVLNRLIVGADGQSSQNVVPFVLNPVISDSLVTVKTIQALAEFRFQYNASEVNSYADPAFSIQVDGGSENVYNINQATGLPFVFVLLPPGTYHFVLKFYDGSNLKLVAEEDVEIGEGGGSTEIDVAPIATEVTYTYTPTATPETDFGNVSFVVPAVIVSEAGGIESVRATAAVVGPLTPLVEQDLSLSLSGASYVGTVNVPGFTAGELTWSIQFRKPGNVLYAYCAQTVTVPVSQQTISETFICEPSLISQSVQTSQPPARVVVDVNDGAGVSGAVVTATDKPIGITGEAAGLGPGMLESFLPASSYSFKATHETIDSATGSVVSRTSDAAIIGLADGDDRTFELSLTPIVQPPPPPDPEPGLCVDSLNASKTYSPSAWSDGYCEVEGPLLVSITESFTVTQGNAGNHWARLYFESLDGGLIVCMYKGNASKAHPSDDEAAGGQGLGYVLHHCYNGDPQSEPPQEQANDLQVGDQIYVDKSIRLRVNGSHKFGPTAVHWAMTAVAADAEGEPPGGGDEPGPAPDGGDEDAPAIESIRLEASKTYRPRRFNDGVVYLDGWAKVRIPTNEELTVQGDPERFMMIVHFGRGIKCWYLGGQWNTSVGGFWERFFQHTFNSPACTWGRRAGDTVWTHGPITARVIMGNPAHNETAISTNIDVLRWWEGDDRNRDHDGRRHWGRRWGWRWWN